MSRTISNPIILAIPLVTALGIGWHQYSYASLALSLPAPGTNMLANGSFELAENGMPLDWTIQADGHISYLESLGNGYVSGKTLKVNVVQYSSGNVTVTSPKVSLIPHRKYLYKGYYKASTDLNFLVRYFYKDGTDELTYLKSYRDSSGDWSTVSDALEPDGRITAVQYVYRIASTGYVALSGSYLVLKPDLYVPVLAPEGSNLIANASLRSADGLNMPAGWSPYHAGENSVRFSYAHDGVTPYLRVTMSRYSNGEAKWQYPPLPVRAFQYLSAGVAYRSTVSVPMIAEYVMHDGTRRFDTIATLSPASDWTSFHCQYEVPPGADTATVTLVLGQNGTLDSKAYAVNDATKLGVGHWEKPLVSITFDDGWQSAYTNAYPVLRKYGLKATFYINPSSIETSGFLTAQDLRSINAHGDEIAAHGYAEDDLTAVNDKELAFQISQGRDYLQRAGFRVTDFATPYGNSDAQVERYTRLYFRTTRGTITGVNTYQNFEPNNLKILYVDTGTSAQTVAGVLERTKLYRGWLILVYHRVLPDKSFVISPKAEITTVTTQEFIKQIDLIRSSGIQVQPVNAAFAVLRAQ